MSRRGRSSRSPAIPDPRPAPTSTTKSATMARRSTRPITRNRRAVLIGNSGGFVGPCPLMTIDVEGESMSSIFGGRRVAPASPPTEAKPETIIGPTTSLQGHLKAEGTMRIDGGVEGAIEAGGNVLVGQGGRVQGNVSGQNVLVAGIVK